jgi:hypothetical protein
VSYATFVTMTISSAFRNYGTNCFKIQTEYFKCYKYVFIIYYERVVEILNYEICNF